MELFLFFMAMLSPVLIVLVASILDESDKKKMYKVLIPGNTVKTYRKTSNVFDTMELLAEYEILGAKNGYVRMRNKKTGEEYEEIMDFIYNCSTRFEVYDPSGKLVALFSGYTREFYLTKKLPNENCV